MKLSLFLTNCILKTSLLSSQNSISTNCKITLLPPRVNTLENYDNLERKTDALLKAIKPLLH